MRCPACHNLENRVLESRSADGGQSVRRRRECLKCGHRFTTYERIEVVPMMVIKRNGQREIFDRQKLQQGISLACDKTTVLQPAIENLASNVESDLQQLPGREVESSKIGEVVLQHLRGLNEVAYIRFASVYSQFQSIDDFMQVLDHIRSRTEDTLTQVS
ncbi:transcriptional repressor NrdR [filamentous cyanobacterium LEGE 11480]|uniref:Transcriptional repressor NrdR n=1 Tax=Romeriopsis navalis LEGE 11480 TaxID=2777977 RepID=A0A928VUB6_9CYAN|nr:transcriptional regulator NrdR [Romeriopsis navalis]MBE9032725.1 transcriptional repressor NrdR [Romeriopsis navalis LEGE 11480]